MMNMGIKYRIPILNELNRLTCMFNKKGYNASFKVLTEESNLLCMINYGSKRCELFTNKRPDAILVLSCSAGIFGIKKEIGNIPIIKGTKQLGALSYGYYEDEYDTRKMVKEKSKIIKI